MKSNFKLPGTANCVVLWFRNGLPNEILIKTPPNNEMLRLVMLTQHKVGFSEIRAVKAVDDIDLTNTINRNTFRRPVLT